MRTRKFLPLAGGEVVWAYLASFVFCFFQALGVLLTVPVMETGGTSFQRLLFALLLSILFAIPLSWFAVKTVNSRRVRNFLSPAVKTPHISFPVIFLVLLIFWIPCYLAFYPGIMAYDVIVQWRQYFGGGMSTHHPIIHTIIMCGVFQLGEAVTGSYNTGIAVYCFLQLTFLAAAAAYGIYTLQSLKIPNWTIIIISIFYAFFPLFPVLGISTTKDVIFSALFMLSVTIAIKALERRDSRGLAVLFSGFLWLAILFRNNAMYAAVAVALIMLVALPFCGNKRFALRIIAGILAAILAAEVSLAFLQKRTDAEAGSIAEMLSVPCQQIARVYNYNYYGLSEDDMNTIHFYIYPPTLEKYDPTLADPIKENLDDYNVYKSPAAFLDYWVKLGLRFPFTYIDAFLYNTMPLWYMADRSILTVKDCYVEMPFYAPEESIAQDSKIPSLENGYRVLMEEGKILDIPLVSLLAVMAVYTWLLFAASAILLTKKKYECLFLPFLPLTYLATLLLGPCILPRYCLPAILCTPMVLAWCIHLGNRKI